MSPAARQGFDGTATRQDGLASLEFLLVFFPLLFIVMAVWQLALMLNAQLHVGYAAYAAARSASTIIQIESGDEPEGILLNLGESGATKWQRINRAAIPGTLAISPGSASKAADVYLSSQFIKSIDEGGVPAFDSLDLAAMPAQVALLSAHRGTSILEGSRLKRAGVKALYAERATRVLINGRDAKGRLAEGGNETNQFDLSGEGVINVTVEYDFWLSVPYAGRMISLAMGGNELVGDYTEPTLTLRKTVAINTWPRLRAY